MSDVRVPPLDRPQITRHVWALWGSLWLLFSLAFGLIGTAVLAGSKLFFATLIVPVIALAVRRPAVAVMLLLFVLYTRISDVGIEFHGLPSIAQPFVFLLAIVIFFRRTAAGGSRSLGQHAGLWSAMALYAAVLFASSIWALDPDAAIKQGTDLLKNLLIVYIIAEAFDTPQALRLALWSLLAAGVLLATLSIVQAATHTFGNSYWGLAQAPIRQITVGANSQRSSGPVGDPNFYALILTALIPLALSRLIYERDALLRTMAAVAVVLLVGALVLTYSRGGLITLVAVVFLYIWLSRVRLTYVLAVLVLMLPLAVFVPASYWQRVSTLASITPVGAVAARSDASLSDRAGAGQVALAIFADHPLGGVGGDNYPVVYFPYALRLNVPSAATRSHDLYLQVAAETGLAGLITFGAVICLALSTAWRRFVVACHRGHREVEGLVTSCLISLLAYLIGSAFLPSAYPRYMWILVGLVIAATLRPPASEAS